jgi:hypothetical protein
MRHLPPGGKLRWCGGCRLKTYCSRGGAVQVESAELSHSLSETAWNLKPSSGYEEKRKLLSDDQIIQLVPLQRECQLASWPVHKAECKAMREFKENTRTEFKATGGRKQDFNKGSVPDLKKHRLSVPGLHKKIMLLAGTLPLQKLSYTTTTNNTTTTHNLLLPPLRLKPSTPEASKHQYR